MSSKSSWGVSVDAHNGSHLASRPLKEPSAHPIKIAARAYTLSLALSLGPSLLPFLTGLFKVQHTFRNNKKTLSALKEVFRRELGIDGFAFSCAVAAGGGAALHRSWNSDISIKGILDSQRTSSLWERFERINALLDKNPPLKLFISNIVSSSVAILLLQAGRNRSARLRLVTPQPAAIPFTVPVESGQLGKTLPTLDLTILLFVRALDSLTQIFVYKKSEEVPRSLRASLTSGKALSTTTLSRVLQREKDMKDAEQRRLSLTSKIDALVFWVCSARIMWCFVYEPERLPGSYVKWINALANVDPQVLNVLRALRSGDWIYGKPSKIHRDTLVPFLKKQGYPLAWGNPEFLPKYGGKVADKVWKAVGFTTRPGVGGLPCEVVHNAAPQSLGFRDSCATNLVARTGIAFGEAMALYLPVHFIPVLFMRPKALLKPRRVLATLHGAMQSSAFLSAFISSFWLTACLTRSILLARLLPWVSHNFWDGPYGCATLATLISGGSIWLENSRRRGEMALYVLPRALRACLPNNWIESVKKPVATIERLVFVLSLSTLLTAATQRPESLRGLSRWTLAFIMKGPNWKRKREGTTAAPTPILSSNPDLIE